jgi:hypothetical protein
VRLLVWIAVALLIATFLVLALVGLVALVGLALETIRTHDSPE